MSNGKPAKQMETTHPPEVERLLEGQEKQFLPGFFTAGRIPPIFGKHPKRFGYLFLLIGCLALIPPLYVVWSLLTSAEFPVDGLRLLLSGAGAILLITAGWRLVQTPKVSNKR